MLSLFCLGRCLCAHRCCCCVPLQDESLKSKQGDIQLSDQTLVTGTLLSAVCCPARSSLAVSSRSLLSVINLPHTFSITPTPGARKYVITARDDKVRLSFYPSVPLNCCGGA